MAKPNAPDQRKELVEAVHMVEADKDEAAFEKRLKKIAKEKPEKPKRKRR